MQKEYRLSTETLEAILLIKSQMAKNNSCWKDIKISEKMFTLINTNMYKSIQDNCDINEQQVEEILSVNF